jgi:hypothetical protein
VKNGTPVNGIGASSGRSSEVDPESRAERPIPPRRSTRRGDHRNLPRRSADEAHGGEPPLAPAADRRVAVAMKISSGNSSAAVTTGQ